MQEPIVLNGIGYEVGRLLPVAEALANELAPGELARFIAGGFAHCAVASETPAELARAAAAAALRSARLEPSHVDAVVYATCSYWSERTAPNAEPATHDELVQQRLLVPLELQHVPFFGVYLAESGNFVSGLRLALNLMRTRSLQCVLYVTADAVRPDPDDHRAMHNGVFIGSDGAAACVLGSPADATAGFVVEAIAQRSSARIAGLPKGQGLAKYLEVLGGLRGAASAVFHAAGTDVSSYRHLVANNYSTETMSGFCDALGFSPAQMFMRNQPRLAHVFSADCLINLRDLSESGEVSGRDRVLLVSTGPHTFGVTSLRKL